MLTNSSLDTLWTKRGLVLRTGTAGSVLTSTGRVFYIGTGVGSGLDATYHLQNLSTDGVPRWSRVHDFHNADNVIGSAVAAIDGGCFAVGGSFQSVRTRFEVMRYDSLGNILWHKDFGWTVNDCGMDIQHTTDGNLIVAGTTHAYPPRYPLALKLIKISPEGDSLMSARLNFFGPNSNIFFKFSLSHVLPLTDGDYLVTGSTDTLAAGGSRGYVARLDARLRPRWAYVNPDDMMEYSKARELADGSVLVLGSDRELTPRRRVYLHRFSPDGRRTDDLSFHSTACQRVQAVQLVAAAGDSAVYITGACDNSSPPSSNAYVAKVSLRGLPKVVRPQPPTSEPTACPPLGGPYPNPAATEARLNYCLPSGRRGYWYLYNALGQRVWASAAVQGTGTLVADVRGLAAGLYLASWQPEGEKPVTRRLLVGLP